MSGFHAPILPIAVERWTTALLRSGTDPCPGGPGCGDKPLETPLDSHSGSPTPTRKGTWGSIKTIYR